MAKPIEAPTAPRFCRDCKWFKLYRGLHEIPQYDLSSCTHPAVYAHWAKLAGLDALTLVEGRQQPCAFAKHERGKEDGSCGRAGKLFEPVAPPPPAKPRARSAWLWYVFLAIVLVLVLAVSHSWGIVR